MESYDRLKAQKDQIIAEQAAKSFPTETEIEQSADAWTRAFILTRYGDSMIAGIAKRAFIEGARFAKVAV